MGTRTDGIEDQIQILIWCEMVTPVVKTSNLIPSFLYAGYIGNGNKKQISQQGDMVQLVIRSSNLNLYFLRGSYTGFRNKQPKSFILRGGYDGYQRILHDFVFLEAVTLVF